VILQHRYDPAVEAVKKSIMRGDIGKLLWASTHCILYRSKEYYTNQKWHSDSGSGALSNQSIHYIDLLIYMMGDAVSVSGTCRNRLNYANIPQNVSASDATASEDVGLAIVSFANGAPAVIEGTTAAFPGLYNELSIYGENGTFIIRNDKLFEYKLRSGKCPELDILLDPSAVFTRFRDASIDISSHKAQYSDFADSVLNGRDPSVSGLEARKSLKLINAIYTSSRSEKIIYL
jgi:predicted dehydrogenase